MRVMFLIFILIVAVIITTPSTSQAFGVLRWAWDGITNQLGFDRGPVPKRDPRLWRPLCCPQENKRPITCAPPGFYIQAEGF